MERLKDTLENYQPPICQHQPTPIEDPWAGENYRPLPSCQYCHGGGFIHPVINGVVMTDKIIPCTGPGCLADSIKAFCRGVRNSDSFYVSKGITAVEQTFDNFQPRTGTETALKFARQFAQGTEHWYFLLIYGGTGNGKSHLLNAIAKAVLARGLDAHIITTAELLRRLRAVMDSHGTDTLFNEFKNMLVLLLDEWGLEYGSDWEKATLEDLLTSRYATGRPTVVATNLDLSNIPVRLRSRFEDQHYSRIAHNAASDFRKTRR